MNVKGEGNEGESKEMPRGKRVSDEGNVYTIGQRKTWRGESSKECDEEREKSRKRKKESENKK